MTNAKQIIGWFPEYYIILVIILCGYVPPFSFNPVAITLIGIVTLQIIFKNKISRLIIAVLFLFVNLWMLPALLSEFSEFEKINSSAIQLLSGGLAVFVLNCIASFVMISKSVIWSNLNSNFTRSKE